MLPIDLSGRRALFAGVADDGGFGFAIAKSLAEAGASICVLFAIFVEMDAAVAHVGVGRSGPSTSLVGAPSGRYRLPFRRHFGVGVWYVSGG